jgi:hypothetical protein
VPSRIDPSGSAAVAADTLCFPNGSVITPDGGTLIIGEIPAARLYPSRLAVDAGFAGTAKVHLGHGFPGPPRWAHPHQTALLDRESLLKGVLPGHPRSARHSWAGWHDSAEPNREEVRDLLTMRRACVAPTPILVERFYIESHDAADTIVAILRAEASP